MSNSQQTDVSIIVISYNTRQLLAECLRSIEVTADGVNYEVLVVDNASADGSANMVARDFSRAQLIRNTDNKGFAAANNQAIQVASGRYVLLLNSDALLRPGTLRRMVDSMDAQPQLGVLGGQLFNQNGTFQGSFFDFPDWKSELLLLSGVARWFLGPSYPSHVEAESQQSRTVDWVSGALFMVRRAAIEQVGLLDEAFFMYAEEMDWCFRMRRAGWRVGYNPQAQAVHIAAASAHRQPERRRAQVYSSKCIFVRKHWASWQAQIFISTVRCFSIAKLYAWWTRSRLQAGGRREIALNNVVSYRFLLSRLVEQA